MQLFLIGTQDEAGAVNFGMFCWLNFCWDEELSVTICMDGNKATKDHIKQAGMLSACLVTEELLPLADRLACTKGEDKRRLLDTLPTERGSVLDVPVLSGSPLCYELQVKQTIPLGGSDLFICQIRNTLAAPDLITENNAYDLSKAAPAVVSQNRYYGLGGLGAVGTSVLPQNS